MDQIDCLERPNKYFKINDLSGLVAFDHVDAVDGYAINFNLKLQHRIVNTYDFANVAKRIIEKDLERGGYIQVNTRQITLLKKLPAKL